MGLVIKAIAAFCLGLAMLAGLQTAGLMSLQKYLKSERANAGLPRMGKTPDFATNFNASGLQNALLPKYGMIDTREGQRLAVEGAARRVDLMNRAAANAVPLPPRIYGRR
jgi:hypothetical protein